MKNVTYFFILFLLILTPPLFADKNSNEEVLKRLDRIIDNKTAYHVQKEKEIVDLKQRLHRSKDNREKYELCGSLFNAYLHYQADSALYYINGKMNLLPLLNHPELKNEIVINRAEVMGVMGTIGAGRPVGIGTGNFGLLLPDLSGLLWLGGRLYHQ